MVKIDFYDQRYFADIQEADCFLDYQYKEFIFLDQKNSSPWLEDIMVIYLKTGSF